MTASRSLAGLPSDLLADLFRSMVEIRLFEDAVQKLFMRNLIRGSTHLCQGQEAVPVGVCSTLRRGDTITCTYRGHGAVLAMGSPLNRTMGEILGKESGLCGGFGGSMHLTDVERGTLGSFAIVGANLPVAVGAAYAFQHRGTSDVSVAFFGDGATNIGTFHEALNLASVWRLPVIFVCENNLYGEYSPIASTTATIPLVERGASYAMPAVAVDGNDVVAVLEAAEEAVERARAGDGPTFIEALTYRQQGHSRSDSGSYRPPGELERWLDRDPILLFERRLIELDPGWAGRCAEIRAGAEETVAAATEEAVGWPAPASESLDAYTFA